MWARGVIFCPKVYKSGQYSYLISEIYSHETGIDFLYTNNAIKVKSYYVAIQLDQRPEIM